MSERSYDAVVIGAGPNGLAAAIKVAGADRSVLVLEAEPTIGGGARTAELTQPGCLHDVCSAIHPLAVASPFFREMKLLDRGVELAFPDAPYAQPLDDGSCAVAERSLDETAQGLGKDGPAYTRLFGRHVATSDKLVRDLLGPVRIPRAPLSLGLFGLRALRSAKGLADGFFEGDQAKALISGVAAHSMLALDAFGTGGFALMLGMLAHSVGWPCVKGGSQRIPDVMSDHLVELGGEIKTSTRVQRFADLPPAKAYLFDTTPHQLVRIAGDRLPAGYKRRLAGFRYGPGVFKVDWALSDPIPWRAEGCRRAGTIHVGGKLDEIVRSEAEVFDGKHPDRPYVLLAQQSIFDDSRAPSGTHTAWAYCHVPNGSTVDMSEQIEGQIERFAPGFRDTVLQRSVLTPARMEAHNENYRGGDISGGLQDLRQQFTRPVARWSPYATPNEAIYLCSSSTPPGAGVHGMCGYFAARAALARALR